MNRNKVLVTRNRFLLGVGGVVLSIALLRRYREELQARFFVWDAINDTLDSWRRVAGVSSVILKETSDYLEGKTPPDQLPPTLDRLGALASSPLAVQTISTIVSRVISNSDGSAFVEKILDVAVTERGQQLIALTTSNAVHALFSAYQKLSIDSAHADSSSRSKLSEVVDKTLEWAATPTGQPAASKLLVTFMSSMLATYLARREAKYMEYNPFEKVMEAVSKPQHLKTAQKLVSTFCSAGVHAVLKKSRATRSSVERRNPGMTGFEDTRLPLQEIRPSHDWPLFHVGQNSNSNVQQANGSNAQPTQDAWDTQENEVAANQNRGTLRGVISHVVMRSCQSREVRETCAAMAKAGCSGAADAVCIHIREAGSSLMPPRDVQRWILAVVLAWLLFLPLWVFHSTLVAPMRDA